MRQADFGAKANNVVEGGVVAVTDAHDAAIRAKRKIATVDSYDYTAGYPAKLTF